MAHRILLAAAAVLAVFTVGGCDITTGPQKPAQSTCNCNGTQPPQAATPPSESYTPPEHDRRHHEHGWHYAYGEHDGASGGAHSYHWRRAYSEIAVQTYDYHSDSSSTVIGEDSDRHGDGTDYRRFHHGERYDGGGDYVGGAVHGEGWIDGYGRHHDGGEASVGAPMHGNAPDDGARLHPWRGYDVDCPDDNAHR